MKKSVSSFCLLVATLLPYSIIAQQWNNWFFGFHAGVTFNTSPPSPLPNSRMAAIEGCASISDDSGNILFYTDGLSVWNRNNQYMPNGNGLMGNETSSNSAIIVPKPRTPGRYYIFTADAIYMPISNGYRYSEIDMSLDGGKGDVVSKNNLLYNINSTEKMTAVKSANGIDYWVITKEWNNNRFNVYKVDCSGIVPIPVISDVGVTVFSSDPATSATEGLLKVSQNGKKVAMAIGAGPNIGFELLDFDYGTGRLSNPILIQETDWFTSKTYGVEFSPDNHFLYGTTSGGPNFLKQYDITLPTAAAITASRYSIEVPPLLTGTQLGPDNKIYISNYGGNSLSVINNPNSYGGAMGFQEGGFQLPLGMIVYSGLPGMIPGNFDPNSNIDFTSSFINCYVQFSGTSGIDGASRQWLWDFGDGQTGSGQIVNHSYRASGNYTVGLTLLVASNCGITDTFRVSKTITINNVFAVDFSNPGACVNQPTLFANNTVLTVGNITGYNWYFGDGNTSTLANPTHSYTSAGPVDVKLVVSTSGVCRADSLTKRIYVDSKPKASFQAANGCVNTNISFTDLSTNTYGSINQWNWDFGGSSTSSAQHPTFAFPSPGNIPVRLTVSSEHGCIDDTLQMLVIENRPIARFENDNLCLNQPVQFTDRSTTTFGNISSWQWQFGDGGLASIQNPQHTYTREGDFPVSLIVTTQYGCVSDPANLSAAIRKVKAFAGNDTIVLVNEPVQLSGAGGVVYQWSPAYLLNNAGISNPIAVLTNDQVFSMEVTTAQGCKGSDNMKVTVVSNYDIFVPTGFTPNNDGKNDILRPHPYGIKQLNYFTVYNRWGQVVFSTKQIGTGWDGQVNSILQDAGVYVWMINATDMKGRVITKKGTTLLIR